MLLTIQKRDSKKVKVDKEQIYKIADKLGKEEILCQLSEECSELIQSCLKYRRAIKGITPKSENEVFNNLSEEIADVLLNIEQILYLFRENNIENRINEIRCYKTDRWYRRTFISQKEE